MDVRAYRGADCDSDHHLVIGKVKAKLKMVRSPRTERAQWFDVEKLKDQQIRTEYQLNLSNRFAILDQLEEENEEENVQITWNDIKNGIREAAEDTVGFREQTNRNAWFDDECWRAIDQRKKAQQKCLQSPDNEAFREEFLQKRRQANTTKRRKKRENIDRELDEIDKSMNEGHITKAYKGLSALKKGYQARAKMIRDINGNIIPGESEVMERWKQYFSDLLNRPDPDNPLEEIMYQTAEEYTPEPTREEVIYAIKSLKNNKAPGEDGLNTELFKYGGEALTTKLFVLIRLIWRQETKPND